MLALQFSYQRHFFALHLSVGIPNLITGTATSVQFIVAIE